MIHLYGLMIGLGVVAGLWLVEIKLKKYQVAEDDFYFLFWVSLFGGVIGARLYHVMTDFSLYRHQLWDVFKIWQGGMSIIGGVMGGIFLSWLFLKFHPFGKKIAQKVSLSLILDLIVFGLPVSQAIGRWGNFFNQELYGTPTQLPWKIYIDSAHRLVGYEQFSYFQPLFLYEMLLLLLFAGVMWLLDRRQLVSGFKIGTGQLFTAYIFYYSFIRFWIDFIRIDKTHFLNTNLGFNQLILLIIMILIGGRWWLSAVISGEKNEKSFL